MAKINIIIPVPQNTPNIEQFIEFIRADEDIESVELSESMGVGEDILIGVASGLIVEIIKGSPNAIRKFIVLIKKLFSKSDEENIDLKEISTTYQTLTLKLKKTDSETEIEAKLEKITKFANK